MKIKLIKIIIGIFLSGMVVIAVAGAESSGVQSVDTGYTISKVRTAMWHGNSYIVASSYEGTLLGLQYDGTVRWTNKLSGFMNHDLWCEDITGDGIAEVLAANADGSVYCLNGTGKLLWKFKPNDAPMNAVCVVQKDNTVYVVCGGYDKSYYYLSSTGQLIKEIKSATYSVEKPWGSGKIPPKNRHTVNFLRRIRQSDGTDVLAVHGVLNSNSAPGSIYLFKPLFDSPFSTIKVKASKPIGEFRVCDIDGSQQILLGTSSMIQNSDIVRLDPVNSQQQMVKVQVIQKQIDRSGYRVVQSEIIPKGDSYEYFVLFGSRVLLIPPDMNIRNAEVLACRYSFNDMWKDPESNKIILASSQSGGSCIHILDPANPLWKSAYANLAPPGKIETIRANTDIVRNHLKTFSSPTGKRAPLPVYLLSESIPNSVKGLVNKIKTNYKRPVFLDNTHMSKVENWDRSSVQNEKYRNKRDGRKRYILTSDEVLDILVPTYKNNPGISFWGGHGNDPYMYSLDTKKKIVDAAVGKKTVLIYPELEQYDDGFEYILNDLIYPLAEYCQGKNANLYIRTKHTFWQSIAHLPMWSRMASGEFSDVFVPSMEETTDKSMELSVAARLGYWMSGAVDSWGARCARDNTSFNRLRQHSHQMLPNHFLRQMVYNISYGAQYINNFAVDQDYMSLLWELIAKGALYVPKRSEIISFSPIHLSMTEPDEHYLNEGNNVKWTTFYDQDFEENNPFVFSRLNGTWPGAPVTEWDFSRYAAGVKERRLNYLPPYENGLVLITPVQSGILAANNSPRGAMTDYLHPLYKNIMKEYITDGRHYYSADGKTKYAADEYYKTIEADIKKSVMLLPLTVSGSVAWVAAQTSANHLRLTVIDSGYINPKSRTAIVKFHTVKPLKMFDLLDKKSFNITDPSAVKIDVPCGMFRFIDIETEELITPVRPTSDGYHIGITIP